MTKEGPMKVEVYLIEGKTQHKHLDIMVVFDVVVLPIEMFLEWP